MQITTMTNIVLFRSGDITISADYDELVLTSSAPVKGIERITREIMQGEYQVRPIARLLGGDGNFLEGPSLLKETYGETACFRQLPFRTAHSTASSRNYLSGNEALELARSIYDHGESNYGDELTKFLYCVLAHVGTQGVFEQRLISVSNRDDPLRNSHAAVLYVDGEMLSKQRLSELSFPESDPFKGFLGIKLPSLIGQRPEIIALSDGISKQEYGDSPQLRASLETVLQYSDNLFLTQTSSSGLYITEKVSTSTLPFLGSLNATMHLVQYTH